MATHKVEGSIRVLELNKTGSAITLSIFADKERLGTIKVGRGTFRWKNKNEKAFKSMSWTNFFNILNKIDEYL